MASYVWVITDKLNGNPVAAFTDREELCNWLYQVKTPQQLSYLLGWKMRQGAWISVGVHMHDPEAVDLMYLRALGAAKASGITPFEYRKGT